MQTKNEVLKKALIGEVANHIHNILQPYTIEERLEILVEVGDRLEKEF